MEDTSLQGKGYSYDVSTDYDKFCSATAFFSLYSEFLSFLYIAGLSYIIKRRIKHPTSDFFTINLSVHVLSICVSTVMTAIAGAVFGYGLSV
jgi:hypothetical protein